jgi:uroporphyrinogen-III synthase
MTKAEPYRPLLLYTGTRAPRAPASSRMLHRPMLSVVHLDLRGSALPALLDGPRAAVAVYSGHAVDSLVASGFARPPGAGRHQWWAVGQVTASRLARLGVGEVLTPPDDDQSFEGLVAAMRARDDLPEVVAALELEDTPRDLVASLDGVASVTTIPAYATRPAESLDLGKERVDAVALTSPRGAAAFLELAPRGCEGALLGAIGETTAEAMRARGVEPDVVATEPNAHALLVALTEACVASRRARI